MGRKSKVRRLSSFVLLIGLLISLALNYVLYLRDLQDYAGQQAVRLNPYTLDYFDDEADKPYAHPLVVFYGDSRAAQWPAPILPTTPTLNFADRGIGNQTTEQVLGRFDKHLRPLQPDIVVLQVGINDLKSIPVLPGQRDKIVAQCKANLRELVQRSRTLGARVILTTIIPPAAVPLERRLIWSADVSVAINEVNAFVRSLAGEGIVILDTGAALADERGITRSEFSQIFLHLNAQGYAALNEALVKLLK